MLLTPVQIKPKLFESRQNSCFTQGGCASCLHACLLLQSYQYPNLSEVADCVSGQLCRDKECPFSGITKSGRVWRKVPENDARSGGLRMTGNNCCCLTEFLVKVNLAEKGHRCLSSNFFPTFKWSFAGHSLGYQMLKGTEALSHPPTTQ